MKPLNTFASLGAALVIAGAGILGLIDENTMTMLVVILICCMPNERQACRAARRA